MSLSRISQAGTTLFKVPVEYLPRGEGVFDDMFALSNIDKEGSSNEKPVVLPDQVTEEDFRSLLKVLFSQCVVPLISIAAKPRGLMQRVQAENFASTVDDNI